MQNFDHVEELAAFAMKMDDTLDEMNKNAFNNFKLKSGKLKGKQRKKNVCLLTNAALYLNSKYRATVLQRVMGFL